MGQLEMELLEQPWVMGREGIDVKLLPKNEELFQRVNHNRQQETS